MDVHRPWRITHFTAAGLKFKNIEASLWDLKATIQYTHLAVIVSAQIKQAAAQSQNVLEYISLHKYNSYRLHRAA